MFRHLLGSGDETKTAQEHAYQVKADGPNHIRQVGKTFRAGEDRSRNVNRSYHADNPYNDAGDAQQLLHVLLPILLRP